MRALTGLSQTHLTLQFHQLGLPHLLLHHRLLLSGIRIVAPPASLHRLLRLCVDVNQVVVSVWRRVSVCQASAQAT